MEKFIKSFAAFIGFYLLYKITLVLVIGLVQGSSYNVNANQYQPDYGENRGRRIIIAGSSNTRYNFDYAYLNTLGTGYAFRSSSASAPYGLYFTLRKLQSVVHSSDRVLFDLPYTLYSPDQFLPMDEYTLGLMKWRDYKEVFVFSPEILFSFVFQESVFNPDVWSYFRQVYIKYKNRSKLQDASQPFWPDQVYKQDFEESYRNCSNEYHTEKHFICDAHCRTNF